MTEPELLDLLACPHTCPHSQTGFREDSLVGCYLFTGFHHGYYISRHVSPSRVLHRFCNSNCQVQIASPSPTSRPASAAEIKRWLPWLSGLTTDPNKRAWFDRYIAKYPQYAPYYFTSPPPGSPPAPSPFTDGREGVPINGAWFSKLHLGTLPDPDPPAPQRITSGLNYKFASSYTDFFQNHVKVEEDTQPMACISYYSRRRSEAEAPTLKREPATARKNAIDLTLHRDTPQLKAEPVEDVIPPENVAEQSTTDTSQPTVSAQDEMLVDHLSTPELNHPVPVQSVKIETPSMPSAAVDLRPTETAELYVSRPKASETRSSNSSVDRFSHQQDECFPPTVVGSAHPLPHPRTNSTQVKEPSMTLEMYACPHTCPHTPVGFREDSLEGCYLFTGFDRDYVSRHASLQAVHSFCSPKCYVQAAASKPTYRLASDAEIKRWLPWISGLTMDPNKRRWFEDYITKYPQYSPYYFTSPPLCSQPKPSPFTDGRQRVPVSSKWLKCRAILPNPDPPPPLRLNLTRATSYTEFFDELGQSRRLSASPGRLESKAESPSIPFAAQHSPIPEPRALPSSIPSSSPPLATEKEMFAALAALLENPPPAPDPPRNAAEFNATHHHYNIDQFVGNIQDGSLREFGFYPRMIGASPL